MKFFLKRADRGFDIFDESAHLKYTVSLKTDRNKQKIIIKNLNKKPVAEIFNKKLVFRYFSVKCKGHLYVLVPVIKDYFAFIIYGSTYRFLGDISAGRFSLIDVDKTPIMTQKKCWSKFGDGFELEIFNEEQKLFSMCCAVCAAMYISAADTKTQIAEFN